MIFNSIQGQTRIDETVSFQGDPAKQYSIYVPSTYDANVPNKMMVGLHPFNTNRWNSISWCDTLIAFAEANELIMICPDGGIDGKVDDPIDTAFTTFIIDSMLLWYNIDESKIFAMGFSWGGRATYSYGLNHVDRFAGFMPIGSAVNGLTEVNGVLDQAIGKPFYIVHGSNDNVNVRYHPIRNALIAEEACVENNLLSGVGHTIDFSNRNAILTTAFEWLDSVNCMVVGTEDVDLYAKKHINIFPNPVNLGAVINIESLENISVIHVFDLKGSLVQKIENSKTISTKNLEKGIYTLSILVNGELIGKKILIK